jgi:hypothetical protein
VYPKQGIFASIIALVKADASDYNLNRLTVVRV